MRASLLGTDSLVVLHAAWGPVLVALKRTSDHTTCLCDHVTATTFLATGTSSHQFVAVFMLLIAKAPAVGA